MSEPMTEPEPTDPPIWHAKGLDGPYQSWSTYVEGFSLEVVHDANHHPDDYFHWEVRNTHRDTCDSGGKPSLGAAQEAARDALIVYLEEDA